MPTSASEVAEELRLPNGELFFILGYNPKQGGFRIYPLSEAPEVLPLGHTQDFHDLEATAFDDGTEGVWYQVSDESWAAYQEVVGSYLHEGRTLNEALVAEFK